MKTHKRLAALVLSLGLVATACAGDPVTDPTGSEPATTGDTDTDTGAPTGTGTDTPTGTAAPTGGVETQLIQAESCDYGGKILRIEAMDTHTVEFELCSPDPAFLQKLAFIPFGIQPSEHLEKTAGSPLENPVGTGPFVLENWTRGSEIVFSANQDYWGEVPAFDTLVFRWATESAQRITEVQSGNAHFATNLSAPDYELVEADDNLVLLPDLNPNIFYMGFTNTHAPFDNPDVRRAIAMGIDRQRIVDTYYPTGSTVASHFVPCNIENGCVGTAWPEFDPEAARDLLAEAGFPDGFETQIHFRNVFRVYLPEPANVATEIQTQLQENLGITATIDEQESGAFIEASSQGELPGIHLLGWGADYPHVTNFLDYHFAGNPQFGDPYPEIVDLLAQGAATIDPAEAEPIYAEVNDLLVRDVPMVPIANGAAADVAVNTLQGAAVAPFGAPQFKSMVPEGDSLVFVQNAEPISMFCADESDGESLSACEQVLESLYGYSPEGEAIPALAEECVPNDDGTLWTCTLRQGVTFHDGSEFDSADVITSWWTGIDASSPLHVGNTGSFEYFNYLWGGLINAPEPEPTEG